MRKYEKNKIVAADLNDIASSSIDWSKFKNSSILITGGGGLLGSYIIKSFLYANEIYNLKLSVICISKSSKGIKYRLNDWKDNENLQIVLHDVIDKLPISIPKVEYIIHAASNASPMFYSSDPIGTILANSSGTTELLKFGSKCNLKKFLFFSSGEVYGETGNELIKEDTFGYLNPVKQRSAYAESKRLGEALCSAFAYQHSMNIAIVRPFHTYGPGIDFKDGRVFSDFVANVVKKENINLTSDGDAKRPFCYISDAVIAFIEILNSEDKFNAFNVSNPNAEISIKDLATMLSELFSDRDIEVVQSDTKSTESYLKSPIMRQVPCINKIRELGWEPKVGLKEGFTKTISSFFKENNI